MAPLLPDVARLCTSVFRDWPHLYAGDGQYDSAHLQTLATSPQSILVMAHDGDRPVGASTGLPLTDATENVRAPFLARGWPLRPFFYFAESVLLQPYRGRGVWASFLAVREVHAQLVANCDFICACTIERSDDHPLFRSADPKPLHAPLRRHGYAPVPDLRCTMTWREVGQPADSDLSMLFWTKTLTGRPLPGR
ncbi:MAG: GNAT family N-acetyltransferase [Acetobacteraceae bacterium]|nr:GNAT family N-acetyltransferase [Acetobacteraceae bacterium]